MVLLALTVALPIVGAALFVAAMWTGEPPWARRWFVRLGRAGWVAWPLPVALPGGLFVTLSALQRSDALRAAIAPGSVAEALFVTGLPVLLSIVTPRWLVPPWLRRRAVKTPTPAALRRQPAPGPPPSALPAVWCRPPRRLPPTLGHWRWRIDGIPAAVWREEGDGPTLHVRELAPTDPALRELPQVIPPRELVVGLATIRRARRRRPWRRTGVTIVILDGGVSLPLWCRHARLAGLLSTR